MNKHSGPTPEPGARKSSGFEDPSATLGPGPNHTMEIRTVAIFPRHGSGDASCPSGYRDLRLVPQCSEVCRA